MDWWSGLVGAAWWLLDEHGQLAAFLFLLIEEAGTPVPIPGDFIMILAGVKAAQGHLNLVEVLLVMELATVMGASLLYWLSTRAGRHVVYRLGRYVGLTPARLDQAAAELHRRGAVAIFLGRLTPGLRMATPIAAGIFGFPFRRYLLPMALGAFLYILAYTLLGYVFGPRVVDWLEGIELPLSLMISTAMLAGLAFWTTRVSRYTTPAQCPERRERAWAGAVAGFIATLMSVLLANVLILALGLVAFHAPATALAELVQMVSLSFGRMGAGLPTALFLLPGLFVVGSLLGVLYGVCFGNSTYGIGRRSGALFGVALLLVSLLILFPLLGAGLAGSGLGAGVIPAVGETVRLLVYGLVLGALYPALARPPQPLVGSGARDGDGRDGGDLIPDAISTVDSPM
jgi:membrane protein DedA with SNARE-associated domain